MTLITNSLSLQLITIAVLTLQRQLSHNNINNNNNNSNGNQWSAVATDGYDYIVVGSGSSGAVVAARLAAANPTIRVLLLEAGGPQNEISDMPGLAPALVDTESDWQYRTVPQQLLGQAFRDRRIRQPKGKVIGGTSTINWMLYNRGNRRSYDSWARDYGAQGWSYDEVLPYFKRSENNTDARVVRENQGYHGQGGPMQVTSMQKPDQILELFQDVMNRNGIPTRDINGESQLGTWIYQLTVDSQGTRSGTGNAYIDPNPYPNNLHILTNAMVYRVVFGTTINGRPMATGVQFQLNGRLLTVNASSEVIVSAGCIASPQLLMLSGIGPRDHLQSLGIKVIADLPVGNNFQDHVFIHHYYMVSNQSYVNPTVGPTVQQLYDYYVDHTGPLTQLANSITFFSTAGNRDDPQWPNAVIDVNAYSVKRTMREAVSIYGTDRLDEWRDYWRPYIGQPYVLITAAVYRTKSRGTVRLNTTNPWDHPLIDPKYLSATEDMEALVDMTKTLFRLTQSPPFTDYARMIPTPVPGCRFCGPELPLYRCDQYVRCIIRQTADTALHPGGACRMGSADRPDVVVDPRLRVKGVGRLRVADSSVFPELANANTHAASVMVGEMAAQMIKNDNNLL
ncbi:L-sorbose 1-dehydrogenase-like [Oppia nitens]|uniref:L-sorbose 1-dehydrogenase-like n=1 Tax=Oppia nitens TaxID=1686743 RepID=UPI0023D9F837|nr:L-sorbose 1-dehydrogenase-like [Oppia nitens]